MFRKITQPLICKRVGPVLMRTQFDSTRWMQLILPWAEDVFWPAEGRIGRNDVSGSQWQLPPQPSPLSKSALVRPIQPIAFQKQIVRRTDLLKKLVKHRIIAKEAKIKVAEKFFQGSFNIFVNFRALFKNQRYFHANAGSRQLRQIWWRSNLGCAACACLSMRVSKFRFEFRKNVWI